MALCYGSGYGMMGRGCLDIERVVFKLGKQVQCGDSWTFAITGPFTEHPPG